MAEMFDIVAVACCATGIANTFMAKEALEKAAAERGLTIKVETQGEVGAENPLTKEEIASAKAVIIAADAPVAAERFAGRPHLSTSASKALTVEAAAQLIDRALADAAEAAQTQPGATGREHPRSVWDHWVSNVTAPLAAVLFIELLGVCDMEAPARFLVDGVAVLVGLAIGTGVQALVERSARKAAEDVSQGASDVAEAYAAGRVAKAEALADKVAAATPGAAAAEAPAGADGADGADPADPAEGFVKPQYVFLDCDFASRDEALSFLAAKAEASGLATDAGALMAAFLEREAEGSTGMMDGFAIPHAKCAAVKEAAVMVFKDPSGVGEWETMDGRPVHVGITLLVPESEAGTEHLRLLSKVAEALMDERFRDRMKRAGDPEKAARIINERLT